MLNLCAHHLDDAELLRRVLDPSSCVTDARAVMRALTDEAHTLLAKSVGVNGARRLFAAVELGRRIGARRRREHGVALPHAEAVFAWAEARLSTLDHEELWVLGLNVKNHLHSARRVAKGGAFGVVVGTRDVLREVLRDGAPAFVVVHNHPSGDPTPSAEDLHFTERLSLAAETVGVPLLDHVVVGRDGYVSLGPQIDAARWVAEPAHGRALGYARE